MRAEGQGEDGIPWLREGAGEVTVHSTGPCLLEWEERGSWKEQNERPTSFRNRLRWTWDVSRDTLRLEHLRRGAERPVHLVDLTPESADRLTSVAPHVCAADQYRAELILAGDSFELRWRVTGATKQYSLSTNYFP